VNEPVLICNDDDTNPEGTFEIPPKSTWTEEDTVPAGNTTSIEAVLETTVTERKSWKSNAPALP
jgi:hypothetical protein